MIPLGNVQGRVKMEFMHWVAERLFYRGQAGQCADQNGRGLGTGLFLQFG